MITGLFCMAVMMELFYRQPIKEFPLFILTRVIQPIKMDGLETM